MSKPSFKDYGVSTVAEATRITSTSANHFVTVSPVEAQGSARGVGFGGFTITVGIRAACGTVATENFKLYSVLGTFLGPASPAKVLHAVVTPLRDTRTFVTRRVELYQDDDKRDDKPGAPNGSSTPPSPPARRTVMTLTADFMRAEPRSLLAYSRPSHTAWAGPESAVTFEQAVRRALDSGRLTQADIDRRTPGFRKALSKFDRRSDVQGWFGQTDIGLHVPPAGDAPMDKIERLTEKGTGEWYKPHEAVDNYVDTVCAFAYVLDMGIAMQVTQWNRIAPHDLGAVSSLEFALRYLAGDLDGWSSDTWLLREEKSVHAGAGRTYNEAVLRRQAPSSDGIATHEQGEVLASITQQCILRPSKTAKI